MKPAPLAESCAQSACLRSSPRERAPLRPLAGLAASRAIDESTPITGIDIPRLQETLAAENMMIHFDDADVPEDKGLEAPHELND